MEFNIEEDGSDSEQMHKDDGSSHVAKEKDTIKIEESWIKSFDDAVHGYSSPLQLDTPNDFPTIFKVPDCIRIHDPKAYGPVIVSLGPYHHQYNMDYTNCSPSLIDKLKFYYLKKFLKRNRKRSFADYIQMIKDVETKVRNVYSEPVMMSSDYFVRMMLLDCCFVIEVILSIYNIMGIEYNHVVMDEEKINMGVEVNITKMTKLKEIKAELLMNPFISIPASRRRLMMDMLLLENQLPFFLLELLFDSVPSFFLSHRRFSYWIFFFFSKMRPPGWSFLPNTSREFHHFLHYFHSSITSSAIESKNYGSAESCEDDARGSDLHRCIPSATELQDAGVCFEKDDDPNQNLLCISFENGMMKIPQLQVDEYTNIVFRNLIAFEQSYAKHVDISKQLRHIGVEDQYFTLYASLMASIINTDADASLLQRKGIIISWLGNGGEVARLFNNLVKGTSVWVNNGYLSAVYRSLKEHCDTDYNRWKAKLNRDYLSSPWAGISLFAAVALFLLTALQTTYTILSYH